VHHDALTDHGLRVGELAAPTVTMSIWAKGEIVFTGESTKGAKRHKLTTDAEGAKTWFDSGDAQRWGTIAVSR